MFSIGEDWIPCFKINGNWNDFMEIYMIIEFCLDIVRFKGKMGLY